MSRRPDPLSHSQQHPVQCSWAPEAGGPDGPRAGVSDETPRCPAAHPGGKWAAIKANGEGWFHMYDGRAYCPAHVPEWVPAWRARQAELRHQREQEDLHVPPAERTQPC